MRPPFAEQQRLSQMNEARELCRALDLVLPLQSDAQLYKQAGNGVTIPVVYAVGKRIVEIQNELNKEVL